MTRTPAEIANDADHALAISEATNADLLQQLEEANAVIDGCRNVRGIVRQQVRMLQRSAWSDQRSTQIRLDDYRTVLDLFDEVDGL